MSKGWPLADGPSLNSRSSPQRLSTQYGANRVSLHMVKSPLVLSCMLLSTPSIMRGGAPPVTPLLNQKEHKFASHLANVPFTKAIKPQGSLNMRPVLSEVHLHKDHMLGVSHLHQIINQVNRCLLIAYLAVQELAFCETCWHETLLCAHAKTQTPSSAAVFPV